MTPNDHEHWQVEGTHIYVTSIPEDSLHVVLQPAVFELQAIFFLRN